MNMLLTIFAFILFGALLVSDNSMIGNNVSIASQHESEIESFGQIEALVDEITSKAYDEHTIGTEVTSAGGMSSMLGTDGAGETVSLPDTASASGYASIGHFNDVDDYNGYVRIIPRNSGAGDTLRASVRYTSVINPDTSAFTGQSYCKRITVTLTSPSFPKPTPSSPLPSYSYSTVVCY